MLDGKTLMNVQKVSKRWYSICQSDKLLREKIRQHKKNMKLKKNEIIFGRIGEIQNVPRDESTVFRMRPVNNSSK